LGRGVIRSFNFKIVSLLNKPRHCEVRSNRELYRVALLIGDCFVPGNDDFNGMLDLKVIA
jgi:hypothetical protein